MYTDFCSPFYFIVSLSDFNALQEQVNKLMDLIQKLTAEFRAARHEMEASHLEIMDSVQLALATCKDQFSTQ